MEDFFYAGGLPALLNNLGDLLDTSALHGQRVDPRGEHRPARRPSTKTSSARANDPIVANNTLAVLRGNLAPDGAVIKPAAAEERLHRHTGPAVVFENYDDMAARIDDPDLDIDENSVIVLRSAGPQGAPGMPEWGQLPIPKKILEKGVRDMVRISDARMSRHQLRRLRAARRAGEPRRRPARAGRDRRPHRARRRRAAASS